MVESKSVKYFDGNRFYDNLYTWKDKVCITSNRSTYQDYNTVVEFYKCLKQLFFIIRSYMKDLNLKDSIKTKLDEIDNTLLIISKYTNSRANLAIQKKKLRIIKKDLEDLQIIIFEKMQPIELPFTKSFDPGKAIGEGFN